MWWLLCVQRFCGQPLRLYWLASHDSEHGSEDVCLAALDEAVPTRQEDTVYLRRSLHVCVHARVLCSDVAKALKME